jgi:uncharacterized membrane protein YfcA
MEVTHVLLLIVAGIAGGFISGAAGLGGGIVFVPVLLFHFRSIGVDDPAVAALTIGSSLLCTLLASLASTRYQLSRNAVSRPIALKVGLASVIAIVGVTRLVTTRPWFDAEAFQVLFSLILCIAAVRMFATGSHADSAPKPAEVESGWARLFGAGLVAGGVSASAGVGGGVVLVPIFQQFVRLPMHTAVGTSSAAIVLITLFGTITYVVTGLGAPGTTSTSVGFVDVARAGLLALPAIFSARWGVAAAHRLESSTLRRGFAILLIAVAARLAWAALRSA